MATPESSVTVHTKGSVPMRARAYAEEKVARIAKFAPRSIVFARVELQQLANPAADRPSIAKAAIGVSGRVIRAHVAAETMEQAVDRLEARLGRQVRRLAEMRERRRNGSIAAAPGSWRHGTPTAELPAYFQRPPEERELVRQKTFAPGQLSLEEAFESLDLLDYSFYLCTLDETEDDAVVYRENGEEVVMYASTAPKLKRSEAIERLNVTDEPFVFFFDEESGHASVVYRRYDGHYGLISPE